MISMRMYMTVIEIIVMKIIKSSQLNLMVQNQKIPLKITFLKILFLIWKNNINEKIHNNKACKLFHK